MSECLTCEDFRRAPMNHVTMLTSTNGFDWQEFVGPATGSAPGAIVAPLTQPEEIAGLPPRYDLPAARQGWQGALPVHKDAGNPWDLTRAGGTAGNVYGAGFPSALIRDDYLELYFLDYSDREGRRGGEGSRIVMHVDDLQDAAKWASAERTLFSQEKPIAGRTPEPYVDIQDIRWVPELERYVSLDAFFGTSGPALLWSEVTPEVPLAGDGLPDFFDSIGEGAGPLVDVPTGRVVQIGTLVADEKGQLAVQNGELVPTTGFDSMIGIFEGFAATDAGQVFLYDLDVAKFDLPLATGFRVTDFEPTTSGFVAEFSHELDADLLDASDVVVEGVEVGRVPGSVVFDPAGRKLSFVKTGAPLTEDVYTVTLQSDSGGIHDVDGNQLDGNGDGDPGDNYLARLPLGLTTGSPVTVSIPDFVRGPGQDVTLPADSGGGIPISISDAAGVRTTSLSIGYDPTLLTISDVAVGP